MKIFNEETLLTEIESKWGRYGAHSDVLRILISNNRRMNKELKIVHECLTELYNDDDIRISKVIKKYLNKIKRLK